MFERRITRYLLEWKNKKQRKPLVLRGARQVGKTSAVLMFGQRYFKHLIYINLENVEHLRLFRNDISLKEFEDVVRIKFKARLSPDTLIFIDEIQNSLPLIKLLRFFAEDMPHLYIIAAGSLLEAKIKREGFSFPVGRVEFCYMYPLDFFEYLQAKKEKELLDILTRHPLDKSLPLNIHQIALKEFYEYAMIGGMPEAVKNHIENKDLDSLKAIYASLFTGYMEDVYKYSSLAESKYLNYIIDAAPLFAGSLVTYDKFGGSNFRSREISRAFDALEKVMLLYQIPATKSKVYPVIPQRKRPKKLIFLDVGLVNYQMGIQEEFLKFPELDGFYRGRIAEQVVGQGIISLSVNEKIKLFYWAKDKTKGSAEVDFCCFSKGKIFGIEVKSGKVGRLKSLFSFVKEVRNGVMFRIYSGNFERNKVKVEGRNKEIVSLPFYFIPRFKEIARM